MEKSLVEKSRLAGDGMISKEEFKSLSESEICSLYINALDRIKCDTSYLNECEMSIFHPSALDILRISHLNPDLVSIIEETLFLEDVIELCPAEKFISIVDRIKNKIILFRDNITPLRG